MALNVKAADTAAAPPADDFPDVKAWPVRLATDADYSVEIGGVTVDFKKDAPKVMFRAQAVALKRLGVPFKIVG